MRLWAPILVVVAAGSLAATRTDYLSAKKKFQSIETRQAKPGTRIALSSQEINAYVQNELPQVAPKGIRNPRVELKGNNTATGRALINFVQIRSAQGKPTNWFLRKLLEGEHEVEVETSIRSGNGTATVDIQRVEVGGLPISGGALDFLIRNYVLPNYPDAKIGRPFGLHKAVDRIEVQPGTAYVVLKK